jgi:hypothetical protein
VSISGAIAGGVVGTVLLTTGLRGAQEYGLTRMDLPLLLGTVFSQGRRRAMVLGYALHFMNGVMFALAYYAVFAATGRAGWLFGLGLGAVHGLFAGSAFVNILLPAVHPRMGTPWSDARETPLLEPPGFLLANYGERTVVVTFALHLVYGTIVGGFAAGLA